MTRQQLLMAILASSQVSQYAESKQKRRIGVLANAFHYSIGLFKYKNRQGVRLNAIEFIEKVHQCGGDLVKLHPTMLNHLNESELKFIRHRSEQLDMTLELHGHNPMSPSFEKSIRLAQQLDCRLIGGAFGFNMRPNRIGTREDWNAHTEQCRKRLIELSKKLKSTNIKLGVETHLDFTVDEIFNLMKSIEEENIGIVLDTGNVLGTLDHPIDAIKLLEPYLVSIHIKDYSIKEHKKGFQLIPNELGKGNCSLRKVIEQLEESCHFDINYSIGTLSGSQIDINWLDKNYWNAYPQKNPAKLSSFFKYIQTNNQLQSNKSKELDLDHLSHREHLYLEYHQMQSSIDYIRRLLNGT